MQRLLLRGILGQVPGFCIRDHLVRPRHDRPDFFESTAESEVVEVVDKLVARMTNKSGNRGLVCIDAGALGRQQTFLRDVSRRYPAFAIPLNHCQGAAGKIAESAGEITVRAIDQVFVSETPILSEHHFTQTEIANRINRKMPVEDVQLDRISQSLRHLSAGRIDPHSVRDYGSRLLNSSSHQKRRPIDRMKTEDI